MFYKKFTRDDIVHNTVVTHPEYEFFVNNQITYLNRQTNKTGSFSNDVDHVPDGHISLTEMNVNRPSDSLVSPFYIWDGIRQNMFGFEQQEEDNTILPGQQIDGVYPMSASVSRIYYDHSATNNNFKYIDALRNPIELSGELSSKNDYTNFTGSDVNVIAIPSIFYGSSIKRGSIKLNFYVTGALTATLEDTNKNGQLVETYGPNMGQVAGIALYDYGMILLTSSTSLHASHTDSYGAPGSSPSWLSFGTGIRELAEGDIDGSNHGSLSSDPSYSVSFKGTNKIPTMTLMAHADKGEYNFSNNPTFVDRDTPLSASVNSVQYLENVSHIRNIRQSKYTNFEEDFENTTYISQIGIYDKDKNLIAIAKLANPVKKTEIQDYMFKLRMDF